MSLEDRSASREGSSRRNGALTAPRAWAEAIAVTCLLVVFLVNVLAGAAFKSATTDEGMHLLYGRLLLTRELGRIRGVTDGKGPFPALAALAVDARRAVANDPASVDQLFWGRLPTAVCGLGLVLALWGLARWLAGWKAGLAAAWFSAWCPNLIAHSKWITFDVPAALGFVLAVFAMLHYLERPGWRRGALLVLALTAAQMTKVSNLALFPLFVLLALPALARVRRNGVPWAGVARMAGRHLAVLAVAGTAIAGTLNTVYGSWGRWESVRGGELHALAGLTPAALERVPVPLPPDYLHEIDAGMMHNRRGHPAYFHGEHSTHGWLLYFPAALLLKTPLPLLFLFVLALVARVAGWLPTTGRDRGVVAAALLLLLSFMVGIHVDIGVRYVLPVLALLLAFAATAAAAQGRYRRLTLWLVLLLGGWQAVESAAVFPHHLSYFNELAGGPDGGWRWLNDSNVSWGQDHYYVDAWLRQQREPVAINPKSPVTGLVVMDVNVLTGLTQEEADRSAWLRDHYAPVGYVTPAWAIFRVPSGESNEVMK